MSHEGLPDHECVARCQRGDRKAFDELVRRYQHRVYRYVLRMTGSREESLELTQEALFKAFQALPGWQPTAQFRTWLFNIAGHAAIDALRRRRHVEYVPLDDYAEPAGAEPGPEGRSLLDERCRQLEEALARVPPEYRQALLLREVEGMSYDEIAQTLAVPEGTVKSRIARARSLLIALCHGSLRA
jgi:RNA polymerase sigma-70 factor (ECF subfamily)